MKNLILLLLLLIPTDFFGQCNLMVGGHEQASVTWNSTVTFGWTPPDDTTGLLYYRIRRASAISGTYTVLVTVPSDKSEYVFVWKGGDYHYFVTAWYSVIENGVSVVRESVGSNQIRVRTK